MTSGSEPLKQFESEKLRVQFLVGEIHKAVKMKHDHDAGVLETLRNRLEKLEVDGVLRHP